MKTTLPLLALLLLAAPAGLGAQEESLRQPTPEERRERLAEPPAVRPDLSGPETVPLQQAGGSPFQQQGPPRTLRAFWHVFLAFAITILLLFGYALSIGVRLGGVERRLAALGAPEAR